MSCRCLLSAASLFLLFLPTSSHAGANASGSAWLSWDEAGLVTDMRGIPSTAVPLFVHLRDAPDVQVLATDLRWFPYDSLGEFYSVLPAAATTTCGGTSTIPPSGDFEGDSSYTWSLVFLPLDPNRACVKYLVAAGSRVETAPSADFALASVLTKDSHGAVDTLQVLGGASIMGGSMLGIESVDPHEIPARRQTALAIKGRRFGPGAQVELLGPNLRINASNVLVLASTALTATVEAPDSPGSLLEVLVRLPDGRNAHLPAAITIVASPPAVQTGPSLSQPTNNAAAFRKFDLYADRATRWNVHDHVNLNVYPSSLDSDALLVTRSVTDTMGLFKSKPFDGINFNCGCQGFPSYVGYSVTPPQYATSIGMLSMASGVFNGTGAFNDYNVPALSLTWTFADGDSASQTVRVGKHVRNWRSRPPEECGGLQPYYVLPPDSLAAVLYTGPLPPNWTPPGDAYYDAQELPLDPVNRSKKVAALRIAAVDHVNSCGGLNYTSEHYLYGFSIWPNFTIVNRQGGAVPLISQGAPAWADSSYGGFYRGGRLYGTRRTIRKNGCNLAAYAMAHQYFGVSVTPNVLNRYLQINGGYSPEIFAKVASVADTTIHYTLSGIASRPVGDTVFVLSPSRAKTIAAAVVRSQSGSVWTAGIVSVIEPTIAISGGASVATFGLIAPVRASSDFSNGKWIIAPLRTDLLAPASAESSLCDSVPVVLRVKGGSHFVVATGWKPAFVSANTARGTYTINDPGFPISRLIESRYGNQFSGSRACKRLAAGQLSVVPSSRPKIVSSGTGRLVLSIHGDAHVSLVDP